MALIPSPCSELKALQVAAPQNDVVLGDFGQSSNNTKLRRFETLNPPTPPELPQISGCFRFPRQPWTTITRTAVQLEHHHHWRPRSTSHHHRRAPLPNPSTPPPPATTPWLLRTPTAVTPTTKIFWVAVFGARMSYFLGCLPS
ncbi:uncharacterized protein LOC131317148 [Rhododendron vialii]|uniref:uncharacterized protein LOC131317148 n=1 Tax=Rhododendron vialii TaxID=182163 RepID=UPI00265F0215|nr:uncharacterized protein LOC131317148 [Rhododendron vialii]